MSQFFSNIILNLVKRHGDENEIKKIENDRQSRKYLNLIKCNHYFLLIPKFCFYEQSPKTDFHTSIHKI